MCVHQEASGRGVLGSSAVLSPHHPPPQPAFQRKSHLRPQWPAQQGHHSPARLAPGPCHAEQERVSPLAWPRLPLTPTVYTHGGPRVSLAQLCLHTNLFCTNQPQAPGT